MKQRYIVIVSCIVFFLSCSSSQPILQKPSKKPTVLPTEEPTPRKLKFAIDISLLVDLKLKI